MRLWAGHSVSEDQAPIMAGAWNEVDLQPITTRGESIRVEKEFRHLRPVFEAHGEVLKDVEDMIARA